MYRALQDFNDRTRQGLNGHGAGSRRGAHRDERLRAIGAQASRITHEFNNLLMVISAQVAMAKADLPEAPAAHHSLEVAEEALRRAQGLTQRINSFARGIRLEMTSVNLTDVLFETSRLLRGVLPEFIDIVVDARAEPPVCVEGDASQLHRLLINLVMNARDAMPVGGRLTLSVGERTVRSAASGSGRPGGAVTEAVICVADTGEGMSPETKARVFEPFYTTKRGGRGTGLGMAIVHDIVTAHQGRIDVQSEPGGGTRVDVVIPSCRSSAPQLPRLGALHALPPRCFQEPASPVPNRSLPGGGYTNDR